MINYIKKHKDILVIGILSFIMLIIMISQSDKCSFWIDELININNIRHDQTFIGFIKNHAKAYDLCSPLFNFIAFFWYRLVPYGERYLLFLSEFFMALAVFCIGITTRKMIGIKSAIFITIMISSLLYLGQYGNNFRGYPVYILMSALVFYKFVKRMRFSRLNQENWKDIFLFGILLALFVYSHYAAVIICLALFITELILVALKMKNKYCLLSYIYGAILFLPLAILIIKYSERDLSAFWPSPPTIASIITLIKLNLLGSDILLLISFFLGCSIFITKAVIKKKILYNDLPLLLSILIPVFMISIVYFYSSFINPNGSIFVVRYFYGLLPMFFLMCAYAFNELCANIQLKLTTSGMTSKVILLTLIFLRYPNFYFQMANNPQYSYQPWKTGTEWLLAQPDIMNESAAILVTTSSHVYGGWNEYYIKKGTDKSPPINIYYNPFGHINTSFYNNNYKRIYLFSPSGSLDQNRRSYLNNFYSLIYEIGENKISIYDINPYLINDYYKHGELNLIKSLIFTDSLPEVHVYDIDPVEFADGIILHCGETDPYIYLNLPEQIDKPVGIPVCEITYTNTTSGNLQVFWDYGYGLSEENSTFYNIEASAETASVILPIVNWKDNVKLTALRVDPPYGTKFVLKSVNILETHE